MEVVNKSTLKIEDVAPVVEYFKSEDRKDDAKISKRFDIFKTGYNVRVRNTGPKRATVKMELLLDYLGEGRVFSYTCYEVVEGGKMKTVGVMLDNIPVECSVDGKKQQNQSRSECQDQALTTMKRHINKLTVDTLK